MFGYFVPPFSTMTTNMNRFHFLGLVFAGLVAFMLMMGRIRPRETPWVQADARAVDLTPWRFVVPASVAILIVVATIYTIFADFSVL